MSSNKSKLDAQSTVSRRDAISGTAKGAVGIKMATSVLAGGGSLLTSRPAIAAAGTAPVLVICLIDKIQSALIHKCPGDLGATDLPGLDGTNATYRGKSLANLATQHMTWRNIPDLTALFAQSLIDANMADDYNLAIVTQGTSDSGGHSLQNANLSREKGSVNYALQVQAKGNSGLLGPVGFEVRADANNSREAFVGPNLVPMKTFSNVAEILDLLRNSIAGVSGKEKFLNFRGQLDQLATKNDATLKNLKQIRDMVEPALKPLGDAMAAADIVEQQLLAIIALEKAGLANNFMLAIPWDDTNGGGNLTNGGGQAGINPYSGTAMLANVYATLSRLAPHFVTVTAFDGGRSRNNGDSAGGLFIVSGKTGVVNNGMFGAYTPVGALGNGNPNGAGFSTYNLRGGGTTQVLRHSNLHALVYSIATGEDLGIPLPLGISPKVA